MCAEMHACVGLHTKRPLLLSHLKMCVSFCLFICLFVCLKLRSIKFHEKSYKYSRDERRIITNLIGATHGSERI